MLSFHLFTVTIFHWRSEYCRKYLPVHKKRKEKIKFVFLKLKQQFKNVLSLVSLFSVERSKNFNIYLHRQRKTNRKLIACVFYATELCKGPLERKI